MLRNNYFSIQKCSAREKRQTIFTLFLITLICFISIYFSLNEKFFHLLNIPTVNGCPLLTLTGIPCPFCGMGRSFLSLTHLEIGQSFYYNPMGLLFYVVSGSIFGIILTLSVFNKKIVLKRPALELWYVPVMFILIMWVFNILYGHFN